jgi:hypothetical protein
MSDFTDEQKQKVRDWMTSKLPLPLLCPCCQASEWKQQLPVAVPPYSGKPIPSFDMQLVMVPIICKNCAHILFFNAKAMGLV